MPLVNKPNTSFLVSYNGHQFDPNTTETTRIISTPMYDEAQRTIIYMKYLVELRSVIYGRSTDSQGPEGQRRTDVQMNLIRKRLQSPGGGFIYHDRGFGDFSINVGAAQRDVKYGPKPKMLSWEPWGDANAALVMWQVEVCIPECDAAKFENHAMAWNYRVQYVVDADGFTTRKVSGYIEIPQTRRIQADRRLQRSADEYRELIQPQTPVGFRPMPKTFVLNDAKTRLDFDFTDEEMGNNIPPPGCLRVDASMEAHNQPPGFLQYAYTLTATYDLARGVPADIARVHFRKLRDDKLRMVRKFAENNDRLNEGEKKNKNQGKGEPAVIPWTFRVRDPQIYGKIKKCYFQTSWLVVYKAIQSIMTVGFWEPVPDSNWEKWKASLGDVLFNTRGNAGLKFDTRDDLIIDLCQKDMDNNVLKRRDKGPSDSKLKTPALIQDKARLRGWVQFDQEFSLIEHNSTMIHKPLIESTASLNDPRRRPIVNERCQSTFVVVHTGRAIRVNTPVAPPKIEKIGTFDVVPANREPEGFWQATRVNEEGDRIYFAKWHKRYIVTSLSGQNGPVFNPIANEGDTYLTFSGGGGQQGAGNNAGGANLGGGGKARF